MYSQVGANLLSNSKQVIGHFNFKMRYWKAGRKKWNCSTRWKFEIFAGKPCPCLSSSGYWFSNPPVLAGAQCQKTSVICHICSAVDPPEDITIRDPGFLGYLEISWSPPANRTNAKDCPELYQLEYFNTYQGSWSVSAELYSKHILTRVYYLSKISQLTNLIYDRLSGRRWGHSVLSLTCRKTWEWEFIRCWKDAAPTAAW